MILSLTCPCGAKINVEADPLAGQEIIDRLAALVQCDRCAGITQDIKPVKSTPKQQPEYRNPYPD